MVAGSNPASPTSFRDQNRRLPHYGLRLRVTAVSGNLTKRIRSPARAIGSGLGLALSQIPHRGCLLCCVRPCVRRGRRSRGWTAGARPRAGAGADGAAHRRAHRDCRRIRRLGRPSGVEDRNCRAWRYMTRLRPRSFLGSLGNSIVDWNRRLRAELHAYLHGSRVCIAESCQPHVADPCERADLHLGV